MKNFSKPGRNLTLSLCSIIIDHPLEYCSSSRQKFIYSCVCILIANVNFLPHIAHSILMLVLSEIHTVVLVPLVIVINFLHVIFMFLDLAANTTLDILVVVHFRKLEICFTSYLQHFKWSRGYGICVLLRVIYLNLLVFDPLGAFFTLASCKLHPSSNS